MTQDELKKRLESGEVWKATGEPIQYIDEPILGPFVVWLLTLFGGVAGGLIIGFATWGIK